MNLNQFTKDGKFLMLALDHRGSFKKLMNSNSPDSVSDQDIIQLKSEIIRSVEDQFSGVLIDVDYGLKAYDRSKPFLLPVEKSGYTDQGGERLTELAYSVKQLMEMGAGGAKILVYFSPYSSSTQQRLATAHKVMEECKSLDFPYFLEIVTYSNEPQQPEQKTKAVLDSVRMFVNAGVIPSVWKLEYPGSLESCQEISSIVGETPWILLTRGDSFEVFVPELQNAVQAGCKGFLAGRALWQEAPSMKGEERARFLAETLPRRFKQISEMV